MTYVVSHRLTTTVRFHWHARDHKAFSSREMSRDRSSGMLNVAWSDAMPCYILPS
jgi:hypothetical protein